MSTVYSDKHVAAFRVSMMNYADDGSLSFANATMGRDVTMDRDGARALADLPYVATGHEGNRTATPRRLNGSAAPPIPGVESRIAAPIPTGRKQGTLTLLARFLNLRAGVKRERMAMSETTALITEHNANNINYDVWRLLDHYTLPQAAALMANIDPSVIEYENNSLRMKHGMPQDRRAVQANAIFYTLINEVFREFTEKDNYLDIADLVLLAVEKNVFIGWLSSKDHVPTFFVNDVINYKIYAAQNLARASVQYLRANMLISEHRHSLNNQSAVPNTADYLNPEHPRYAPKLTAAIRAWEAIEDPKGKHPAQAIKQWLINNASELGLIKGNGELNKTAIDEITKIANWQPKGGAPKTPV